MKSVIIFTALILTETLFSQQICFTRNGTASFVSNAPLEIIKAQSDQLQGAIDIDDRSFAFTIDNKSFKGFNSELQEEHFYENYMEVQKFPVSTFEGKIIEEIDSTTKEEQVVRAKGILNIHGVEQERIIKGTIQIADDKIRLKTDFTILLEDHQIKIPRVVFQKIAEAIEITVRAELTRKAD